MWSCRSIYNQPLLVSALHLHQFRNLVQGQFSFCPEKNLIYGVNGAGKTSVLEAIYLCAFAKSFLNANKIDIVAFGYNSFGVETQVVSKSVLNSIRAEFTERFAILLNNKKSSITEINSVLYPLFFSSQDYWSYIDSVAHLRKLVDRFIFGVNSLYIHYILRYNHCLRNKTILLKNQCSNKELESWNKVMAEMGFSIYQQRKQFIHTLNETLSSMFPQSAIVHYHSFLDQSNNATITDYDSQLFSIAEKEKQAKRCLLGIHKDEYAFFYQNKNVRTFSSGEKKKFLMMIFLAYIQNYHSHKHEFPVFLIDDYDAAIDEQNVQQLLDYYPNIQVIATSVRNNMRFEQSIQLKKEK